MITNQPYVEYECDNCGNVIRFMGDEDDPPKTMQSVCLSCSPTSPDSATETRRFELKEVMI